MYTRFPGSRISPKAKMFWGLEFPLITHNPFPLHGPSFWDCCCVRAHTFGIGLLFLREGRWGKYLLIFGHCPKGGGTTMGRFKESSYVSLLLKNVTILTTITTFTTRSTRNTTKTTTHTIFAKKNPSLLLLPVFYNGKVILASSRARELFLWSKCMDM